MLCHPQTFTELLSSGLCGDLNSQRADILLITDDHLRHLNGRVHAVVVDAPVVAGAIGNSAFLCFIREITGSVPYYPDLRFRFFKHTLSNPRIVMTPISSSKTREGDLILSSDFAAFTAAPAAKLMAEITPERPALMPVFNPAIAFAPAERNVVLVRPSSVRISKAKFDHFVASKEVWIHKHFTASQQQQITPEQPFSADEIRAYYL